MTIKLTPTTPSENAIAYSRLCKALKLIAAMQSVGIPNYEWIDDIEHFGFSKLAPKQAIAKIAGYEHVSIATWQFVEKLYPLMQSNMQAPFRP